MSSRFSSGVETGYAPPHQPIRRHPAPGPKPRPGRSPKQRPLPPNPPMNRPVAPVEQNPIPRPDIGPLPHGPVPSLAGMSHSSLTQSHRNRLLSRNPLRPRIQLKGIVCLSRHSSCRRFVNRHPVLFCGFRLNNCRNDDSSGGHSIVLNCNKKPLSQALCDSCAKGTNHA